MSKKQTILIVDDSEMNRSILINILSPHYTTLEASNGIEALALLQKYHFEISLVLLDIIMPEMDGFETLTAMKQLNWFHNIPVITISAENSADTIERAYNLGVVDYINRPFDKKTVQRRVHNTIMLYSKQKMLEDMVAEQILEKEQNNSEMIEILSNIVEFRNGESGLHVLHIRLITEILLQKLGELTDKYVLSFSQAAVIVNSSALHDIGKISIPEKILNKPGKLTKEEFEIMKTHSIIGAEILKEVSLHNNSQLIKTAHDICRWHHERYDGNGYPDGLKKDDIPISAQVVSLADVYDALTSERVYKSAYSHEKAMKMILNGECGIFNPILLQCLIKAGSQINHAVKTHSYSNISKVQIQQLAAQMIAGKNTPNQSLTLFEQEHIKSQLYTAMSNEIQFEMNYITDTLTLSGWNHSYFELDNFIVHPSKNKNLQTVFSCENYKDFCIQIKKATHNNPIISKTYRLLINGKYRWHKAVAYPLWRNNKSEQVIGIIGKFIDIHEDYLRINELIK